MIGPFDGGAYGYYVESFNGKLRDELLNVEVFDTLWEAKILAEGAVKLTDLRTLSKAEYAAAAMTSAGSYHRGVRE